MQVVLHDSGTGSQRGLHRGRNMEPTLDGLLGQKPGAKHDTWVACVRAAGDRGDDHTAVVEGGGLVAGAARDIVRRGPVVFHFLNLLFFVGRNFKTRGDDFDFRRFAARGGRLVVSALSHRLLEEGAENRLEVGQIDAVLRALRPGHARLHGSQIEFEIRAVVNVARPRHAEHLLRPEVRLERVALRVGPAGAAKVVHRLGVHREITHGRTVFRRHVGNRRAVGQRKRSGAFPVELNEFADHFGLAEQFGDMQGEVRGGDALAQTPGEIHSDHFRGEEINGLSEHAGLRLDAAHPPADHTETVDHGGVRIGADQSVRVVEFLPDRGLREHPLGEVLEIHLVDDADARRNHAESLEGLLPPLEKLIALAVALEFHIEIEAQGVGAAEKVHLHGVIDDQVDRNQRLDHGGILPRRSDRIAHGGQVDQQRHAGKILEHNAGDHEGNLLGRRPLRMPGGQHPHILFTHFAPVAVAEHGLQNDADADRQPRDRAQSG